MDENSKVADVSIILPGEGEFPSWEDCEEHDYALAIIPFTIDENDDFPF